MADEKDDFEPKTNYAKPPTLGEIFGVFKAAMPIFKGVVDIALSGKEKTKAKSGLKMVETVVKMTNNGEQKTTVISTQKSRPPYCKGCAFKEFTPYGCDNCVKKGIDVEDDSPSCRFWAASR